MAKPANPLAKIATKIAALQVKSAKLNEEMIALSKMAAEEAMKASAIVSATIAKPVAKATAKKTPEKKAVAKPVVKKPAVSVKK